MRAFSAPETRPRAPLADDLLTGRRCRQQIRCASFRVTDKVCFLSPDSSGRRIWGVATPTLSQYYVYIMSSYRGTLYTGVTNDLERRVYEHRHKLVPGFTEKYNVSRLVFWQASESLESARAREKEIKGWRRSKKVVLIEELNPYWSDLSTR